MTAAENAGVPPEVSRRIALALQMLELGAWVFPLAAGTKVPLVSGRKGGHGFLDANNNPDWTRTFLSNPGFPNYGVVFPEGSDIIVLDLDGGDREKRPAWQEDWQRLYERLGPPGLTFIVRTPSGGRHAYYRWAQELYGPMPDGDEMLGWTVRKPWKGYLVGPGSIVKGETYEPVGLDVISDFAEAWARAAIAEKGQPRATTESVRLTVRGGPQQVQVGHRHAYLRNQARHLVGLGLRGETLFSAVMDLNRQLLEPKTEDEVRRAIGEAETKFEPDELDEQGRPIVSAQRTGALGRKPEEPPKVLDGLQFYSASQVTDMTPEAVDWAWGDYLAFGTIVEVVGPPKAGKTTMVFNLVRSFAAGEPFLDRPTAGGAVVVLTEQGPTSLKAVLQRADLHARDDVHFLLHRDTRGSRWTDVITTAIAFCKQIEARLLVVDTLPAFAGLQGDAENNAGDALAAMEPLMGAAADGLAVLVNRHRRKVSTQDPGLDIADEGRGSGAFSGAVDVILSLRRRPGGGRSTIRVLAAASRFDETPEELFVELQDGRYVALGDDAAVESAEARVAVAQVLADADGRSIDELVKTTKKTRQTLQRVIDELVRTGALERRGTGKRGDPHRFYRVDGVSAQFLPISAHGQKQGSGVVSAQTPSPYGGGGGFGTESDLPTSVARPADSTGFWAAPCHFYTDHQSHHRQGATGWYCDVCSPEGGF